MDFATDCLPEVAWIEKKVLSRLAENPDALNPTTAKVMRDLKKSAGVLREEIEQPAMVSVHIRDACAIALNHFYEGDPQALDRLFGKTKVVDAEVVKDKEDD